MQNLHFPKMHILQKTGVLFGIILFSCIVTRTSAFLLRGVNCLLFVDCLRRGVGSLCFQPCSEVAVWLTSLMLFHSLYVASSFAADLTNKFNKAFIRSHHFIKLILAVMEKVLKPQLLDAEPGLKTAADEFKHWLKTFEDYLDALSAADLEPDKYKVLANLVSSQVYRYFADVEDYDPAIGTLKELYVKPKNMIAAKHELLTCKQMTSESIDNFVVRLKRLSQECECQAVSAERYCLELMRDAFITGIQSHVICQRLLEESTLNLEDVFRKARAMELAFKNSEAYQGTTCRARLVETQEQRGDDVLGMADANHLRAGSVKQLCYFCGNA